MMHHTCGTIQMYVLDYVQYVTMFWNKYRIYCTKLGKPKAVILCVRLMAFLLYRRNLKISAMKTDMKI